MTNDPRAPVAGKAPSEPTQKQRDALQAMADEAQALGLYDMPAAPSDDTEAA